MSGTMSLGPYELRDMVCTSTSAVRYAMSPWVRVEGFQSVRALLTMIDRNGDASADAEMAVVYQTAAGDTSDPGAWTLLVATWVSDVGSPKPVFGTPSVTGKYWIRFGVAVKNDTASQNNRVSARLSVDGRP